MKKWAGRINTNAFRLYDRDIPEIPLVLDLYGDAVSGAFYKRRFESEEPTEASAPAYTEDWLPAMTASIARALGIDEKNIFLKERQRMRNRQETGVQYGRMSDMSFYRDVHEGDLRFRVNLSDYLDTGLFLDARKKRALLRQEAAEKRVLNLFAYTCSLSAAAAKGGAFQVDSVDLSNTYLEWGRVNFALNGLESSVIDGKDYRRTNEKGIHRLVRSDVQLFLQHAKRANVKWDIIILDPPGFSNSKKMSATLDIRRDHRELISSCLSILSPGGKLWFSSNAKGFDLQGGDFPGFTLKDMKNILLDEDFKGKKTPLCYAIERQ